MNVPLLDLKAQHEPIRKDLLAAMERVLDQNNFILGREVSELEEKVAAYSGTRYAIGVSSGTDALVAALMALDLKPGDEVITTPLSFFATVGAIVRVGATPVFVDIDPITYNLDARQIAAAVTPRTKAIIPVHLYGQCADMTPILQVALAHNLAVVEDAAQAIGAEYGDGRRAGSMGTMGCFSFFPSKNLGGLGDGGMIVTNDEHLAERLRVLRVQGGKPKYYHRILGGNFRLDTIQAAVLNVKLPYLDRWTALRQHHADLYESLFRSLNVESEFGIRLPQAVYKQQGVRHYHIYNQFVIGVPKRDALRDYLKAKGIGTEIYYPVPLHRQECLQSLGYKEGDYPEAERACRELVALPIYPELHEDQQHYVAQTVREGLAQ
ncbi:MAG: DegT/DnrJ/EryC1/StrS family aminotransferase [Nitrospira sp.]|jgi:dTDP-4-amino-4,6-dideoxygalactose transaminase|nr:DegT/DnrJ/EryC1/StrS family aminotransferase [Nitrospira sp.]